MSQVIVQPDMYSDIKNAQAQATSNARAIAQAGGGGASAGTAARAFLSSNAGLLGGNWITVPIDTLEYDQALESTDSTSTPLFDLTKHRYDIPSAGVYQINGQIGTLIASGAFFMQAGLFINRQLQSQGVRSAKGASVVSDILQCSGGDFIELWGFSTVAVAIEIGQPPMSANYLSVVRVA